MEKLRVLKLNEMKEANGGWIQYTPHGMAIWLSYEIISNWSDVKSGIKDGVKDGLKAIGA